MQDDASKIALKLQEPFNPADIEWRAQQSGIAGNGNPWMIVMPYITSRAIQQRLDEVFGPFGYEIKQEETKGLDGFMCSISVLHDGRWVTKQDVAPRTDIEPLKGGASGALKRAGALWGIGRYLYHLESGFAACTRCENKSKAFNNFVQIKDKSGHKVGVDWKPPALPLWALPGLKQSEFSENILNAKSIPELKTLHDDAYRWASSFGKMESVKQFEQDLENSKNRLNDEAKDNIAERFTATQEWLDGQMANLARVPDAGSVRTLGARIGELLTKECAGQFFDKDALFDQLKKSIINRVTECEKND